MNKIKGKNLLTTNEYVTCPYCGSQSEQWRYLHWKHLKLSHNKTLEDVRKDFPDHPTMTQSYDEDRLKGSNKNKENKDKKKHVNCVCGKTTNIEVGIFDVDYKYLQCCIDAGLDNPDKRSNGIGETTRQKTLMNKYGVTNLSHIDGVIEKRTKTNDERYGGTGFASKGLAIKTRQVIKELYGSDNIMQTEEMKHLFSGSNNPMSKDNPDSIERRKRVSNALKGKESKLKNKTYDEIHGEEKSTQLRNERSEYFKSKFQPNLQTALVYLDLQLIDLVYQGAHFKHKWLCKKCNNIFEQLWNSIQQGYQCPTCFPRFMGDSKSEREIREYILSLGLNIECNTKRIISPKELDIFIPEKNIAIEHNGLYMHSEERVGKSYHLKKTLACEKVGIKLIHIFEDEWIFKQEIVKERLKYLLGLSTAKKINARECIIKEIDTQTKDQFLIKHHIQGTDIGTKIRLGAFFNNELISVMTFSKLNISKGSINIEDHWELSRFCSDSKFLISGIAGKLLEYFKRNYKWKQILTYADRRWSSGNLYKTLGFEGGKQTQIDYWYSKGGLERISRFKLRKRPDEPKDIPEYILRSKEGYFRIYGCGNLRFTMSNK